jgi:hypothetical protein
MSTNFVGGALVVAALGGLLYLHGCKREESKPVKAPTPITNPAPVKPVAPVVPVPAPAPKVEANPCTVAHPCHPVKPVGNPKKPVYHKVLKGGKLDGPIDCKRVPEVAKTFTPEQVMKAAKQYGLTPEQLAQLRVCLN